MQIKKDERNEIKSTSHSRYRCQYHIVFAPKYRRKEIYGQLKECGNTGGRGVCRPHTYAGEYSTVPECSTVHGISQGEEQLNDFRQACEFEVQVWVEEFLVQRVLCGYCGTQQKDHSGVYPKST